MKHNIRATEGQYKHLATVYLKNDKERLAIENTLKVYEDLQCSSTFIPVNKNILKKYILAAIVEQHKMNREE